MSREVHVRFCERPGGRFPGSTRPAMESFFGLLKRERVYRRHYQTRQEARTDLFDYIERFYNRKRRHGSAGRMSPLDYEESVLNQPVH